MLNPKFEKAFQKGLKSKEKGNHELALAYFRKAMKLDGDNPAVWFHMAEVFTILGNHIEAMKCYLVIKGGPGLGEGLDPDNIEAWINEAALLMDNEMFEEAGGTYQMMLEKFPDNAVALKGIEEAKYELANVKYCINCGSILRKNEKFCLRCGKAK